jgi:hypothetical protein
MNVDLMAAVRRGEDLNLDLPCGASLSIPGEVLSGWASTPASSELLAAAAPICGEIKQRGPGASPILDVILQLLPTLLPVLLPLLVNSFTKPTTTVSPKNDPPLPVTPK